jgi:DNA primase catalytic core
MAVIAEIKNKVDIIEIVAESVQLTRKGQKYWGLCPFHDEKTASFSVNPDRQSFYCFGCRANGDAIDFIQKINHLTFQEARNWLASRAGITAFDSPRAKAAAAQAAQERQKFKLREAQAMSIMREQYGRLCNLEKTCQHILNTVHNDSDLDRPEVIEALHSKDKIGYWLNEWQYADDTERLDLALMLVGTKL